MADNKIRNIYTDINEFVKENGTGIHKGGDIYDNAVYFRVFEFLCNAATMNAIIGLERVKACNYNQLDLEYIYQDTIESVVENYDPEAGMTFVSYAIQKTIWKIQDENRILEREADIRMIQGAEDDQNMDDPLIKAIDQANFQKHGYRDNDGGLLKEEQIEGICDLLYNIMQVVINQKRTKAEIFRLFYTDTLMTAFSDYVFDGHRVLRHEKQIVDNMERGLVDYIFADAIFSLKEMAFTNRKKIVDLMGYYSNLEENKEEVEKRYLSVWGIKEKQHSEEEVYLPLSNAVFLAYIFIKEYEKTGRREIPEPHKPPYLSNYSGQYKELINSFFTPEIKAMYN